MQKISEKTSWEGRIYYMDALKGMLAFLVMAGHCLALYREDLICDVLFWFIYSFHMPVFIFVSGYFSKKVDKAEEAIFAELIIPLIPFEFVYWVMHLAIESENAYPFFTPIYAYWYIVVLFFCRIVNKIAVRIRGTLIIGFFVALLAGYNSYIGEYFTFSRFLCLFPFFFLGYQTEGEHLEKIRNMKQWVLVIIAVTIVMLFGGLYIGMEGKLDIFYMNGPYKQNSDVAIRMMQFLISMFMILFLVRIMPEKKNILTEFGKGTYLIYMLNFYFVEILSRVLPEGIVPGWNAAICFLYAFGAVLLMNSKVSWKIFNKMTKCVKRWVFRYELPIE